MDIRLLSNMLRELLLTRSEVGLPGLGYFVTELVPASFADRGYSINPPYRRVSFVPGRSEDDSLVRLYAESNEIDFDQSKAILQHFLEEVKKDLLENKTVEFPGLGRLRATKQNNIFFIGDENLDIYPDGFGLAGVSLKNHTEQREEPKHVAVPTVEPTTIEATPAAEPAPTVVPVDIMVEPVETSESPVAPAEEAPAAFVAPAPPTAAEPAAQETPASPPAQESLAPPKEPYFPPIALREEYESPVSIAQREAYLAPASEQKRESYLAPEAEPKREAYEAPVAEPKREAYVAPTSERKREKYRVPRTKRKRSKWLWLGPLLFVLLLAVLLAVFMILSQVAPDFIDSLLYTPEQLEIINY